MKELSSANVRLNGIVKTGHDALKEEQDLVRKLQDQIGKKSGKVCPRKMILERRGWCPWWCSLVHFRYSMEFWRGIGQASNL